MLLALALFGGLPAARAQSGTIDGQVTKVDASAKKITIKHGPIPKLDMDEGMTMVFAAPDADMLKAVKEANLPLVSTDGAAVTIARLSRIIVRDPDGTFVELVQE